VAQLSLKLRNTTDNGLMFFCPGCKHAHHIQHGADDGPRWGWNGDAEKPTFTPSVLVRGVELPDNEAEYAEYVEIYKTGGSEAAMNSRFGTRCHSFITDGRIQFLNDCTHELAGQTVELPDWPKPSA
jgi:Family of unknown function (DUF6527)